MSRRIRRRSIKPDGGSVKDRNSLLFNRPRMIPYSRNANQEGSCRQSPHAVGHTYLCYSHAVAHDRFSHPPVERLPKCIFVRAMRCDISLPDFRRSSSSYLVIDRSSSRIPWSTLEQVPPELRRVQRSRPIV